MKKFFIAVLIFAALPFTAFANELPTLTLEEATRRAINNSTAIRNFQDNITLSRENEQRIRDIFWETPVWSTSEFVRMQADLMRMDAGRAVNLSSITAQRETLGFIVANHFSNITMAQNELALFDKELALMAQDLEMLRVRQSLGMASQTQLSIAQNGHQQALNNRVNLVSSIDASFRELNRLMGASQGNVYELVFELPFEPLQNVSINHYVRLHQNNDVQVEQASRQLSIARFELDNHGLRFDPLTGIVIPGGTTRTEREITVTQANRDLEQARESVENNVIDLYNNILNLQLAIQATSLQINILLQELEVLQVQYYVGHLTRIEIDRAVSEIYNLQETLRRQETNHSLMVMQLTNPNIALGF